MEVFVCSKGFFNIVGRGLGFAVFVVRGLFYAFFVRLHICELVNVVHSQLGFACFNVAFPIGVCMVLW